jgi:hypothetical protein
VTTMTIEGQGTGRTSGQGTNQPDANETTRPSMQR